MEEENYGINKEFAHPRAIELIPEDFFWDCVDELTPFGSDEGDLALSEFRDWKKENPNEPIYDCIKWVIEDLTEKPISEYNEQIINRELIKSQVDDEDFDDEYYLFTVDISVIATGFGQLVDEGKIDESIKPIIQRAITRQKIQIEIEDVYFSKEYIANLIVLERVLKEA